jgi:GH15 family glucan-1,4-alpha-glucosidase
VHLKTRLFGRTTLAYAPIESYAVIGDLNTIALVGIEASIDFLCFPDFDSPTIFASLLDYEKGGHFSIRPTQQGMRVKQMYLPDTNILLTRFLSDEALVEITDCMPICESGERHHILRRVKCVRGTAECRMVCKPAFDYGRQDHTATLEPDHIAFSGDGPKGLRVQLASNVPLSIEDGTATATFTLKDGGCAVFIFACPGSGDDVPVAEPESVDEDISQTSLYWRNWVGKSSYRGRWREMVNRSALALKLLTSRKYGSIIAAATFGLPERIGGERNWDYRYTWLRDASFTLYAFMRLGYVDEAAAFMKWLGARAMNQDGQFGPLQLMYRIDGGTEIEESTLPKFEGYQGSSPVRIGNAASKQLQLDIYGELMDAMYLATKYGDAISHEEWAGVQKLISFVASHWQEPDKGIWEVRSGSQQFLHSRVMCWVAVDRALRLSEKRSQPAPLVEWQDLRNAIHQSIFDDFYNHELGAFVAYTGADFVDASALLMPLVRFISPTDPLWLSTLKVIERDLVEDALVFRYRTDTGEKDGLSGTEGSFTACSFWYVECLARGHQVEKAQALFDRMLGYSNHVGLYSEELSPIGEHLGNFPQAFTHLALISAATYLDRVLSGRDKETWR